VLRSMTEPGQITYSTGKASEKDILKHLQACNDAFVPPLSSRVDLETYSRKLSEKAVTFEAWAEGRLMGLIAAYFNNDEKQAFITSVSVVSSYKQHGVASTLLAHCKEHAQQGHFSEIRLEVNKDNVPAVRFYTKYQFAQTHIANDVWTMSYHLNS